MLSTPGFHHLHLNSMDLDAAIDFYTRRFPTTSRTSWGGLPALHSPTNVLILFTSVNAPPKTSPQTAIWHFGWHVLDTRQTMEKFKSDAEVTLLPLYTGDQGGSVFVSSDTWPGAAGERFNHVHMYQEDPFCAQLWYQTHLNAPLFEGRGMSVTEDTCLVERGRDLTYPALEPGGMYRTPASAVEFDDVAFMWYMRQGDQPLVSPRGYIWDHIGLSVNDLDAWVDKLRGEGVKFLEEPYKLGDTRAAMIEGPSLEAIELVEVR